MFENLTERFNQTIKTLRGQGRLTEENISDAMRSVRMAMLEADVALPVVREFIQQVKTRALGEEVQSSLSPGQSIIKIVNEELTALMGETNEQLKLNVQPPAVVLMAGLQGAGKTTTVAKLARYLKDKLNKKIMVVSCDVYRPAAIEQLKVLAGEAGAEFYPSNQTESPVEIAEQALTWARRQQFDVLLIDTAGRLHVDEDMMQEIQQLHRVLSPVETLFIVDSMMGQDAVNAARVFNEALPLTGVILTKADGDARGGAALSVRYITGKPIKFIGTGEKCSELSPFYPDRIASRILGMGDVLSLIEEVEQKTDREKAEVLARKIKKGRGFTLEDFREQIQQMQNMGGLGTLIDKLPGLPALPQNSALLTGEMEFVRLEAIINSMTMLERRRPELINGSRKKRIAAGSGTRIQDVNRLLKQFSKMQKMMKKFSGKGGMQKMLKGLGGNFPGGRPPFH